VNSPAVRRLGFDLVLLLAFFGTADAYAASVLLVQPPDPAPAMAEAIVRVRGELISEGFSVDVLNGMRDAESRSWLEQLAGARKADAVVAVLGGETPDSVEVWVIDKVTEKSVVRRIPFQPQSDHAAKTFAIHALELLRASFLEIDLRPSGRPREAKSIPPAIVHFVDSERQDDGRVRFGVEVGGAAVVGFGDVGTAILPVMRLKYAFGPSLVGQVEVAGLGSKPRVANEIGSAEVAEEFALLGGGYRFALGRHLRPILSLSVGALHTRVTGQAISPDYRGRDAVRWSFLADAGVGIAFVLAERFELTFATHAQVAEPYPAIRFAGSVVATSTRPSLLFTLTLGAWR
jgi:hypothetical protein